MCACIDADGLLPILETAWARGRVELFNMSPDPTVMHTLYCSVLYCTVLYCTVLYCTVLFCTVLYRTVQVRHTLWTQMVGGCFVYCSLYAVNQVAWHSMT